MERISSRQNPVVRRFRDLARGPRHHEAVLLDGVHLVDEALNAGVPIEAVAFAPSRGHDEIESIVRRAEASGARTISVSAQVLAAISPVRQPAGIVAIARCGPAPMARVLGRPPQLVLLVAGVQDPGNVGAIIRTAEACGATGVITTNGTADPFAWKALRGSMGSAFRLPIAAHASVVEAARAAANAGLRIFASVPRGGTLLASADLSRPSAILLGSEGGGLDPTIVESADELLAIPMAPPVESLNVATAAALILYEASRQRAPRR